MQTTPAPPRDIPELRYLDRISRMMDTQFRVPLLNIRFGWDVIIGLVPVLGDLVTLGISMLLIVAMLRHGASGMVLIRMIGNTLFDFALGAVPVAGDLADFAFKANRRNYRLLREHYQEGKHQGSGLWVILLLLALFVGLMVLAVWFMFTVVAGIGGWIQGLLA